MEVSGVVFRPLPCFSGAGIDSHSSKSSFSAVSLDAGQRFSGDFRSMGSQQSKVSLKPRKFSGHSSSGFCDDCHLQYYYSPPRCSGGKKEKEKEKGLAMLTTKKKLKLLKGLARDLSIFSDMGFGLDPDNGLVDQVKAKMISEAAEVLLGQLQQLRAEEKESKRRRKQEKAKRKATQVQPIFDWELSSGSSSESSNDECGEVVDLSRLRSEGLAQPPSLDESPPDAEEVATLTPQNLLTQERNSTKQNGFGDHGSQNLEEECCSELSASCISSSIVGTNDGSSSVSGPPAKRIEVCLGNRCKKSGAAALLEEFDRIIGVEGAVVGCKCMGKCRDGPNVKVLNSCDAVQDAGEEDSVRTPINPLCIGVGLEDVGVIVANFFGDNRPNVGLVAST